MVPGVTTVAEVADTLDEFVSFGEVRAEVAYQIKRDVAIRCGLEFLYFGRGIIRTDNAPISSALATSGEKRRICSLAE